MKVEFTGRHVDVSEAIKKHTKEQLEKIEKVFDFESAGKAHIILDVEKHRHRAEIVFRWRDQELTALGETDDMYTAITQAVEKLERQVLKLKEKKTTLKRQTKSVSKTPVVTEDEELESLEQSSDDEQGEQRIVRSSRYAIKPMTPEEAATIVSESDDQFLVFRDSETDRIGVIYKRKDGNFGLIEP
ncbi:MAG: ribosome-associated translation inhibitor RaiA [Blastocatellia bacterium]|nr:ribosome-associated translation inhibitor RaiA [Blastocatellia bacterium]